MDFVTYCSINQCSENIYEEYIRMNMSDFIPFKTESKSWKELYESILNIRNNGTFDTLLEVKIGASLNILPYNIANKFLDSLDLPVLTFLKSQNLFVTDEYLSQLLQNNNFQLLKFLDTHLLFRNSRFVYDEIVKQNKINILDDLTNLSLLIPKDEMFKIVLYDYMDPLLITLNRREKDVFKNLTSYTHLEDTEDGKDFIVIENPRETKIQYDTKLQTLKQQYPELTFTENSSFQIEDETKHFIDDVLDLDNFFMSETHKFTDYDVKCMVLFSFNSEYLGHVWIFTSFKYPDFCGIYGMNSSIINIINRENKGVARTLLLQGVIPYAKHKGCTQIIVPWPLPPMVKLLKQLGFKEFNTKELTQERTFLKNITTTTNYFTLSI